MLFPDMSSMPADSGPNLARFGADSFFDRIFGPIPQSTPPPCAAGEAAGQSYDLAFHSVASAEVASTGPRTEDRRNQV